MPPSRHDLRRLPGRVGAARRRARKLSGALRELREAQRRQLELAHETQRTLADVSARLQRVEEIVGGRGVLGRTIHVQQGVASLLRATHLEPAALEPPERLAVRRFRLLSQNEEDGITLALLQAAGPGPRRFVELGCGTNGGNSGFLAEELGFAGLMVDANAERAAEARRRFSNGLVRVEHAWLTRENVDALVRAHVEGEVDLLSIDVDGNDVWLWQALKSIHPRVVIVEYNSLLGPERSVAVAYDPAFDRRLLSGAKGALYGASLAALERVGRARGYRLVAAEHRGGNAFFVRDDLAQEIPAVSPARAYRMLDKHRLLEASGYDVFAMAREHRVALVEPAP